MGEMLRYLFVAALFVMVQVAAGGKKKKKIHRIKNKAIVQCRYLPTVVNYSFFLFLLRTRH